MDTLHFKKVTWQGLQAANQGPELEVVARCGWSMLITALGQSSDGRAGRVTVSSRIARATKCTKCNPDSKPK